MKNTIEDIVTFFIIILIILILAGTTYFCLDVFGIIEVPEKYSMAAKLYSKIEVIASSGENLYENVVTEDFDTVVKKKKKKETVEEVVSDPVEAPSKSVEEILSEAFGNKTVEEEVQEPEESYETDANKFYYYQLDTYGKLIYDKLYANKDKLKTGTYTADFGTTFDDLLHLEDGSETLNNSFQLSINALTFDNPELFYLDVTKIYLLTEITTRAFSKTYKVAIGGNGNSYLSDDFSNSEIARNSIEMVEQCKNAIIDGCRDLDTVEKIRYVNNYLVDNTEYDMNAGGNIYNIYGTLIGKRAVCEGYARSCKYILDDLGIPCIIACGIGKNSTGATESHAWNYVQVDGNWYALDVTWNDPIITNGRMTDAIRYEYFLNGANKFFADHFEDGNIVGNASFEYPELSVLNYK